MKKKRVPESNGCLALVSRAYTSLASLKDPHPNSPSTAVYVLTALHTYRQGIGEVMEWGTEVICLSVYAGERSALHLECSWRSPGPLEPLREWLVNPPIYHKILHAVPFPSLGRVTYLG